MVRPGAVLQSTYVLEEKLGAGGMGEVFAASHTRLHKRFAVKVLSARHNDNPEAFARFRREAEISSRLGHPNIVEVFDFNETEDGQPFLVMELLDGEDLGQRMARGPRPMDVDSALRISDQIASALQAAHAEQVVHRDLKPQNVFLARRGRDEAWVKLLDFGISKIRGESSVTQSQVVIGTPGYMSPEQAEGRARTIDARSDQFSLAVIVYEMLAGECPFTGDSIPSTLYRVVHHQPPPLAEVRAAVPAHVSAAVARAMSKRAEDRYPDIATFAAALEGKLVADPPAPRPAIGARKESGLADTLMHANTEVSTAGMTDVDAAPRRVGWWLGGAAVIAAVAIAATVLWPRDGTPAVTPPEEAIPAAASPEVVTPEPEPVVVAAPVDAGVADAPPAAPAKKGRARKERARPTAAATTPAPPVVEKPAKPEPEPKPKPKEDEFIVDF